ncbi:unnamed protein product [Linum tenue]|uniref:BED-type domain-containing protein n=1 Tax=Linum tenue TaxID=586396 RepID=A0AAV0NZN5_9ROSI|nr:unnamed protein product [Linum tenue]
MAGEELPANLANNNVPAAAVQVQPEGQLQPVIENQGEQEQQPYERKKRKKTSKAWEDFKEVVVAGVSKLECCHCKTRLHKNPSGCTSHFLRHIQRCTRKPKSDGKEQQHLSLETNDSVLAVQNFKDDHAKLFHEFVEDFRARNVASAASDVQTAPSACTSTGNSKKRSGRARFDSMVQNVNFASTMKSELDIYLEEGLYVHTEESMFDIIGWWKEQRIRFKVLSRMACDIMAIPVTLVASEATFSAGGRVIDPQRASLGQETVEAPIMV